MVTPRFIASYGLSFLQSSTTTPYCPSSEPLRILWNFNSLRALLHHCKRTHHLHHFQSLHSLLIKSGSFLDHFFLDNLVSLYAARGHPSAVRKLFDEMPHRTVITWTTAISAFSRSGEPDEALRLFFSMLGSGDTTPNAHTYASALKACSMMRDIETGRWIHQRVMNREELRSDTVLMNAALDTYVKCGCLHDARRLFDDMLDRNLTSWNTMLAGYAGHGQLGDADEMFSRIPEPDVVSYNTIIAGFAKNDSAKALEYVKRMNRRAMLLDRFTFPSALNACGVAEFEVMGKQIHCSAIKCGFETDPLTGSALIDMYAKYGEMDKSKQVYIQCIYGRMPGLDLLALSNSMVSGLVCNGEDGHALNLISDCHRLGIVLDAFGLSSALKACFGLKSLRLGIQVHGLVVVSGYHLNCIVGSVLMNLYLNFGCLKQAFLLFDGLQEKDTVAWGGLVSGCVQHGLHELSISLFKYMINSNHEVDDFVLSSILKACSGLSGCAMGKQVHAYSIKMGSEMERAMITSFIDMYSKYGEIESALRIFERAPSRDIKCWTGAIVGCARNGRGDQAIKLFDEMTRSCLEPNKVTFLGVLTACRHAGLMKEACSLLEMMPEDYGLTPSLEHYSCIVNVLGRAGHLEEAWKLICGMPYEPDESIWNSLLAASGIHGSVHVTKLPVKHLLSFASQQGSIPMLVALSNVYAGLGMWDKSRKLRNVIGRMGPKEAGMSWVDVRN